MAVANGSGQRVTLTRIARELGVSAKTVSNAFNRPDQLSAELRARILDTARRLDFAGPDPLARAFRQGRSGMIGVIYANGLSYAFDDPAAVAFLGGVAEVIEPEGLGITLIPGSASGYEEPSRIAKAMVDGVVAYSLASDDPALNNVRQRGLSLVIVDQPYLPTMPWIGIDDERAAAEVARHVVELGHRNVGIVSFGLNRHPDRALYDLAHLPELTYEVSARRMTGYASVLLNTLGSERLSVVHMTDSTEAEGARGVHLLLDHAPALTAIICLSDRLALGAYAALGERGLTIPTDVSVVGFDDIALAQHVTPGLTTVRQPHRDKGRRAGQCLVALLRNDPAPTLQRLPHTFIERGSTSPRPHHGQAPLEPRRRSPGPLGARE